MSNLRQAAQQALEALEGIHRVGEYPRLQPAVTALRAALAEDALQRLTDVQQEMEAHDPVDYRGWVLREVLFYNGEPVSHREPEQEPVAWRTFDGEGGYEYRSYDMNEQYAQEWEQRNPKHKGWVEPLYTAASPCPTCEALARAVMMDQTGTDA